jgi:hypothetical protein
VPVHLLSVGAGDDSQDGAGRVKDPQDGLVDLDGDDLASVGHADLDALVADLEVAAGGLLALNTAGPAGVGWDTVMTAVRDYGRPLVEDPARLDGVHTLGVDETAFPAATPTAGTTFATGIAALGGRPRLLDVVEGRSGTALHDWVSARDQAWRDRISVAALDPFRGYATALRTSLPLATRVLDAFHVVRLGLDAVDQVRRRVQQETLGHGGHAGDPLFPDPSTAPPRPRAPQRTVLGPAADRAGRRRPQ